MCVPPGQVLVLVEVLEEGGLTDELLLLTHLLAGAAGLGQLDLQSAERRPHHLTVAEVLTTQRGVTQRQKISYREFLSGFQTFMAPVEPTQSIFIFIQLQLCLSPTHERTH